MRTQAKGCVCVWRVQVERCGFRHAGNRAITSLAIIPRFSALRGRIAGQRVSEYRRTRRGPWIVKLREQSTYDTGEHISHARRGHARIAAIAEGRYYDRSCRRACRRP